MTDFVIKPVVGTHKKKYPPHRYKCIPQHPTTALFIGTRNSGKSTIIHNLLSNAYKKYFHRIIIMSPNINMDELYMDLCTDQKIDISDCHAQFDDEILQSVMDRQIAVQEMINEIKSENEGLSKDDRRHVPKMPRVLIIIDDSAPSLGENKVLKNLFQIGRHQSISTFLITQKYKQLNTALRANAENIIITRVANKQEMNSITEEKNIPILARFLEQLADEGKYNFAWIDRWDKVHKNFSEKVYN